MKRQSLSFKHKGREYVYSVTTGALEPPVSTRRPLVGDIHVDTRTSSVFICHKRGTWDPAITGTTGTRGLPLQEHPNSRVSGEYRLHDGKWRTRRAWYNDNTRTRALVGNDGTAVEDGGLDSGNESSLASVVSVSSTSPPPRAIPAASNLPAPSAPSGVKSAHSANVWLIGVLEECRSGRASAASSQSWKIDALFQALLSRTDPIPRLTASPTSSNHPSGVVIVGPASRSDAGGAKPSLHLAYRDLFWGQNTVQLSNSVTNEVEDSAEPGDFAYQLSLLRSPDATLPLGEPLLVAFDIPFTPTGLGSCRWEYPPFSMGVGGTVLDTPSNCWTPAGAVTYPHTDDFACGMYMVHWKGKKLWLVWPGTPANLRKVGCTHLGSPDITMTLELIRVLEGLHLIYCTEEEFFDYAFYLLPGTIHCCVSVTEACHAGRAVRTVKHGFLPVVEQGYAAWSEWLLEVVERRGLVDQHVKLKLLDEYDNSLQHWRNIEAGIRGEDKVRLRKILDSASEALATASARVRTSSN